MALVYSIGKSVEGRDLWVTRISKEVKHSKGKRQRRRKLKPLVKIAANMHGNEVSEIFYITGLVDFFLKMTKIHFFYVFSRSLEGN